MRLRFITGNPGKLEEARTALLPLGISVVAHRVAVEEIQAETTQDVARHKAQQLLGKVRPPYFLEDAGFFVDALNGFPGVYSHYVLDTLGCAGILKLLMHIPRARRTAGFAAVIAFVDARQHIHLFRGVVRGRVVLHQRGSQGFGFDPIFIPEKHTRTFAQMTSEEKSAMSHRGRALRALAAYLKKA